MSAPTAVAERTRRARAEEFMRFCVVGGAGFAVDAGVLLAAVHLAGIGPIAGRFLSFALAVWTTFELNRQWAFRSRGGRGRLAAFARYLGVQSVGFAFNFGLYTVLYLFVPAPFNAPVACLFVASGAALLVNYLGASVLVFSHRGPGPVR